MDYFPNSIGPEPLPQGRDIISIWNVYLPLDQDRERYIKNSYLTSTITVTNSNGEIVHRVQAGKLALQAIRFPIDNKDLGSQVICCSAPYSGKLYVVDVFDQDTEYTDLAENQYRFKKASVEGFAEVLIDGNTGLIILNVDSESTGGKIKINIANKDKSGELDVSVNGDINLNVTGNINLSASQGVTINTDAGAAITVDDAGINIDGGQANVFVNGSREVLYSLVPGASVITDVAQIGVSQTVKVGE